jgi:hypothetical protein
MANIYISPITDEFGTDMAWHNWLVVEHEMGTDEKNKDGTLRGIDDLLMNAVDLDIGPWIERQPEHKACWDSEGKMLVSYERRCEVESELHKRWTEEYVKPSLEKAGFKFLGWGMVAFNSMQGES